MICDKNEFLVKMKRVVGLTIETESFYIMDKDNVLYKNIAKEKCVEMTLETCLPITKNYQYSLLLANSDNFSWSSGSYLQIYGFYDNIVFKGFYSNNGPSIFPLSFYTPILKNDQWKFSSSVESNWYSRDYPDDSWCVETLGITSKMVAGTQYFRKEFVGLNAMSAYEVSFNYRYGIIGYINGIEIFRDNMPEGEPTTTTKATGGYPSISYRSVIRPGNEVSDERCTLAVALYFISGDVIAIHFNAFLSIYASSYESNCYVYPYHATVVGYAPQQNIWDWNYSSFFRSAISTSVDIILGSNHTMFVNGIRLYYAKGAHFGAPTSFRLVSSNHTLLNVNSYVYDGDYSWHKKLTHVTGHLVSNTTLTVHQSQGGNFFVINELQFLTCNLGNEGAIAFPQSVYSFYTLYHSISISPISDEFTNCTISPELPSGLSFNSTSCTLSGNALTTLTTVFTVTSILNDQTFTGSFTIKIESCTGSYLRIQRVTSAYAYSEAYRLKELSTNKIISEEVFHGHQIDNWVSTSYMCVSGGMYELVLDAAFNFYNSESYIILDLLLSSDECEHLGKFNVDFILGTPSIFTINLGMEVPTYSNWYYKMGSIPSDWYKATTSGWNIGQRDNFNDSPNQIQLYKKTFRIFSVDNAVSIGLHVRFQHGIIVYLNNEEIYRKGVNGELSTSSFATSSYPSITYHSVYLPTVMMATPSQAFHSVIHVGTNILAIALVASNSQQVESTFDCMVRITTESSLTRAFDMSVDMLNIRYSESSLDPFVGHHSRLIVSDECGPNSIDMVYENDRREWISSLVLQNWYALNDQNIRSIRIEAKNPEDPSFTVLKEVSNLEWSYAGQSKRIWLTNNKAYNQYRFSDIGTGDPSSCSWKLNRISLYSDRMLDEVPIFHYPSSLITTYNHVEIAEIYPNSDLYRDFTVAPALPAGIILDPDTGMIFGTPHNEQSALSYTVSAHKYNTGEVVSSLISVEVINCSGDKSLITMTIHTDNNPDQGAYKLFRGKGTSGSLISSVDSFPCYNNFFYSDFCLPHDIYTVQAISKNSLGWGTSSGLMFSVDLGSLRFDVSQVKSTLTSSFSSFLPFQMGYDNWRVYNNIQSVPSGWKSLDFDDSTWRVMKASEIGASECVTVYVRRSFTMDHIEYYNVLNVQVKYRGGVVAYFNGRRVARFNLEDPFSPNSESITIHDASSFSKFHIILEGNGGRNGTNVMSFEIHRAKGDPASTAVLFDATGVFGVNDCSVLVDSFELLTSSPTTGSTILQLWSLAPFYSGYIENKEDAYIDWIVENLEGSPFNSFGILTPQDSRHYSFSVYGYPDSSYTRIPIIHEENQMLYNRERNSYYSTMGLIGFRHFYFKSDSVPFYPVYVSSYLTEYCKVSGSGGCAGESDYVGVNDGELSISRCEEGLSGYTYRVCRNGKLGPIQKDTCQHKQPGFLEYPSSLYTFVKNAEGESSAPSYVNIITLFSVQGHLPEGFELDPGTGILRGIPSEVSDPQTFTITGSNPAGSVSTTITFNVREGRCESDGVWESTSVGTVLTYECNKGGLYVGTQKRACVIGKRDGEWQAVSGKCISIQYLIILSVSIIFIFSIFIFCIFAIT